MLTIFNHHFTYVTSNSIQFSHMSALILHFQTLHNRAAAHSDCCPTGRHDRLSAAQHRGRHWKPGTTQWEGLRSTGQAVNQYMYSRKFGLHSDICTDYESVYIYMYILSVCGFLLFLHMSIHSMCIHMSICSIRYEHVFIYMFEYVWISFANTSWQANQLNRNIDTKSVVCFEVAAGVHVALTCLKVIFFEQTKRLLWLALDYIMVTQKNRQVIHHSRIFTFHDSSMCFFNLLYWLYINYSSLRLNSTKQLTWSHVRLPRHPRAWEPPDWGHHRAPDVCWSYCLGQWMGLVHGNSRILKWRYCII
jgi:hypothetical protein